MFARAERCAAFCLKPDSVLDALKDGALRVALTRDP